MEEDKILLSHKSICLRKSDVSCFDDFRYLNDLSISFYYELLNEKFSKYENEFILLDPSCVSTIFFDDDLDDLKDCFGALDLDTRKYIFIPINDTIDKFAYGSGNHWALVFYCKTANTFYYMDSMKSFIKSSNEICRKINLLIGNSEKYILEEVNFEKFQQNTFDCGVFVLNFTEVILNFIFDPNKNINKCLIENNGFNLCKIITKDNSDQNIISIKRKEMKAIVLNLIRNK